MDRYKFRGKRLDNGEWVFGSLINNVFFKSDTGAACTYIVDPNEYKDYSSFEDMEYLAVEVDPSTVGQYTGLKDKKGVEIYEGDIMDSNDSGHMVIKGMVAFRKGRFVLGQTEGREDELMDVVDCGYTVIGNIHDNKEILEG